MGWHLHHFQPRPRAAKNKKQINLKSEGVGLIHVGAQGYTITDEDRLEEHLTETELFSLWLSGECYE